MRIFKIKLPLLAAIVAVVFTVGTTAFTKIGKNADLYTFAYQPNSYSQTEVEDPANWTLGSPNCSPDQAKACQMTVDATYTHINPLTQQPELNTTTSQGSVLDIQTGTNNQTDFYVEPTTGVTNIINKE